MLAYEFQFRNWMELSQGGIDSEILDLLVKLNAQESSKSRRTGSQMFNIAV